MAEGAAADKRGRALTAGSEAPATKKGKGKAKGKETGKFMVPVGGAAKSLPTIVKATCMSLQGLREIEGITNDVMLFPKTHPVIIQMKEATGKWSEQVATAGKGHALGPPHLPAWEAFLATMKDADVGGAAKTALRELEASFREMSLQDKLLAVRVAKQKQTFDEDYSKVTIAVRGPRFEEARPMLMEAAKQAGAKIMTGKAPPSGLERKLQTILDEWTTAAK
jgi:hypothetical protein